MAQIKLLILVANLVCLRLALASLTENQHQADDNLQHQYSSASVFNDINSLDYAANVSSVHDQPASQQRISGDLTSNHQEGKNLQADGKPPSNPNHKSLRRSAKSASTKRQQQQASMSQVIFNLLGQLEKVDVKRIIADSLRHVEGKSEANGIRRSHQAANNQTNKTKERVVGAGSLGADTGNLLSIGKQLVKLARSQVGSDFNSWISPMMAAPSFLSSASHFGGGMPFGESLGDFGSTAASAKSDWFWMVVPAVIVIGAGVIVIPLIAAWLISNVMSQNTFTVSAGRRRRRDIRAASEPDLPHNDLLKMLDIHQLLDDPQLLVDKLARFHKAIESVGSRTLKAALDKQKEE